MPEVFGADQVFVPQAVAGESLVRKISHREIFTPNADGANDFYELSFTVVKTDQKPRVRIFSLEGIQVAELQTNSDQSDRMQYLWDGVSADRTVSPGVYLVHIEVAADARDEVVQKLVHVAY